MEDVSDLIYTSEAIQNTDESSTDKAQINDDDQVTFALFMNKCLH